jgi:hypothetical protein
MRLTNYEIFFFNKKSDFYNKFYRAIVGLARFFLLYLRIIFHFLQGK